MKAPLLMVRLCALTLSLLHLVLFVSLFVPYMADPRVSLWLTLLPAWDGLFVFSRAPFALIAFMVYVPWLLPLIAAWSACKPATKTLSLLSLVGLWISLPLTCVACFFWSVLALELYAPSSGLQGLLSRVLFVPPAVFALSAGCCFVAARFLRRLLLEEQAGVAEAATVHSLSGQHEEAGRYDPAPILPAGKTEKSSLKPGFAHFIFLTVPGLLCQIFILVSLSSAYTLTSSQGQQANQEMSGWQMLGLGSATGFVGLVLLLVPLFPGLALLADLLPFFSKNGWAERLLAGSISLSYWLNLLGFLLSGILLAYVLLFPGSYGHTQTLWPGATTIAFLLALIWSGLLRAWQQMQR